MKSITIKSFAKVNLSIDVTGLNDNGYHNVEMVMQEVGLYDRVSIVWEETSNPEKKIELATSKFFLPTDDKNIAYKAAQIMIEKYGDNVGGGVIKIDIEKIVPVAAGLAGGSGNGAAVLHGINKLWKLNLDLDTICELGAMLGSDVPFQVRCQAKCNKNLDENIQRSPVALTCALATGTGTELEKVTAFEGNFVLVKPAFSVSTKEVYDNIDNCEIVKRPNNEKLIEALNGHDSQMAIDNMVNVLEAYTTKAYPQIEEVKTELKNRTNAKFVMMSGSGPTVFGIYDSFEEAQDACATMRELNYETYFAKALK